MAALTTAFDVLLALAVAWLAWQAIHGSGLFRAVISYMVFGLLMAIAWVRLDAPDIALAEAAIGAGVTGALLLSAIGRLPAESDDVVPGGIRMERVWLTGAATMVLVVFGAVAWQLPAPGLGGRLAEALPQSGVDNAVTAVLLDFRAFDTLLEIGILLLGTLAIWSFGQPLWAFSPAVRSPSLPALGRLLFPMFVLVSAYLLWRGGHAPGGAFPAGAVMGAGGILMLITGARPWLTGGKRGPWRVLLSLGFVAMLSLALALWAFGDGFFSYPPGMAGPLILGLELMAGLSIALLLFALYLGGEPPERWDS